MWKIVIISNFPAATLSSPSCCLCLQSIPAPSSAVQQSRRPPAPTLSTASSSRIVLRSCIVQQFLRLPTVLHTVQQFLRIVQQSVHRLVHLAAAQSNNQTALCCLCNIQQLRCPVQLDNPAVAVPPSSPAHSPAVPIVKLAEYSPQLSLVPCAATHLCVALMADPTKEIASIGPIPVAASSVPLSLSQPAQRVTSVLLNGKNFHAWSRSFQLYLGGKRKTRWILGKEPKPTESDPTFDEWVADNCIILGWICMLMPAMSPGSLSSTEISPMPLNLPWDSWLQVNFGYLKTRWEELAQYEPLSDFPSDGAAFAIVDGDERRRRLLPSISLPEISSNVPDQTAFVAPFETRPYCQHCHKPGHLIDRCFVLHPGLKSQFNRNRGGGHVGGRGSGRGGGRATPRVGAIADIESIHTEIPNLNQLQTQIAQLQSHLGLVPSSSSSGPMANIAAESPTALHGSSSFPGTTSDLVMEEGSAHPRPLPILDSPPPLLSGSHAPVPLPASSPDSGISSPVVSDLPFSPLSHPSSSPPSRFLLSHSTNHPIANYLSYQGLSNSYQSFLSQVDSVSPPRSVHEALQNPLWVSAMKVEMDALQRTRT
ncbi:hypothetical protein Acr_03g0001300 [Actinidia rufa]|uniref:Retrotransposon Copia-like N-terminal domain-containing protein n=1 Tax=Actinidia rufa TaxID=165716 RepID=A0A7J0EAZ2_9ERIC|nr:hypothetical protein Acr_03g0001300 [Actinidia rufa]